MAIRGKNIDMIAFIIKGLKEIVQEAFFPLLSTTLIVAIVIFLA